MALSWHSARLLLKTTAGRCKVRGRLIDTCHFPKQSPIISVSFAENDLQLEARGGGLGSRPIFKKFNETNAPS